MLYAVCTQCSFLRAFGERASDVHALESCPACGGEVVIEGGAARFQPTYVGRVAIDLHGMPALEGRPEGTSAA